MRFRDRRLLAELSALGQEQESGDVDLVGSTEAQLRQAWVLEQVGKIGQRGALQLVAGLTAFAAWARGGGYPGSRRIARHPGTNRHVRRGKRLKEASKRFRFGPLHTRTPEWKIRWYLERCERRLNGLRDVSQGDSGRSDGDVGLSGSSPAVPSFVQEGVGGNQPVSTDLGQTSPIV